MFGKRAILLAGVGALMIAVTAGIASAEGFGGRGGHGMWLLARAAGLNNAQIVSAFHGDTSLLTDRNTLKNAKQAMLDCMVAGTSTNGCSSQIASYSSAKTALEQERMTVWAGLFKTAPNLPQASTVLSHLEQLRAQRQALMRQVFGASLNSTAGANAAE